MKMKLTFLLLVSVFFVSCGMPSIFYLTRDTDYTLVETSPDTITTYVQGKLSMNVDSTRPNNELFKDSDTKGPSLMFFYTFDDDTDINYTLTSSEISTITTKFKEEFMKNTYYGIPVDASKEILSITLHDSVNINKEVYLYGVSPEGINNTFNASDKYVLYAQNPANTAVLDSFTLTKTNMDPPTNKYTLDLSWPKETTTSPTFISNASADKLYAFDGQSFTFSKTEVLSKISDENKHEYDYVGDNPTKIQMHLFAAFFITGSFSNYFWSDLVHLGSIPIQLT